MSTSPGLNEPKGLTYRSICRPVFSSIEELRRRGGETFCVDLGADAWYSVDPSYSEEPRVGETQKANANTVTASAATDAFTRLVRSMAMASKGKIRRTYLPRARGSGAL